MNRTSPVAVSIHAVLPVSSVAAAAGCEETMSTSAAPRAPMILRCNIKEDPAIADSKGCPGDSAQIAGGMVTEWAPSGNTVAEKFASFVGSALAGPFDQPDQLSPCLFGVVDGAVERQPRHLPAAPEIGTFRVHPGHPPVPACAAEQLGGVELHRICVLAVHVRHDLGLGDPQGRGRACVVAQLAPLDPMDAPEAGDEVATLDLDPPNREILE